MSCGQTSHRACHIVHSSTLRSAAVRGDAYSDCSCRCTHILRLAYIPHESWYGCSPTRIQNRECVSRLAPPEVGSPNTNDASGMALGVLKNQLVGAVAQSIPQSCGTVPYTQLIFFRRNDAFLRNMEHCAQRNTNAEGHLQVKNKIYSKSKIRFQKKSLGSDSAQ